MDRTTSRSQVFEHDSNRATVVFAVMHAVFFIASLAVIPIFAPSAKIPNPFGSDELSRHFFLENAAVIRLSDWLQLASAVCLALLSCVWSNPQQLNMSTRNLIVGGSLGSAVLLILAAITSWSLASPGGIDPGAAFRALQFLPFLFGGPGWAAFFSIFIAGVSQAIVGRLPGWLVWTGYGLSVTSALATLVLVTLLAAPFLPLTRFVGFLWLITAATLLNRASRRSSIFPTVRLEEVKGSPSDQG